MRFFGLCPQNDNFRHTERSEVSQEFRKQALKPLRFFGLCPQNDIIDKPAKPYRISKKIERELILALSVKLVN